LGAADFSAILLDLRCATFFQWCAACLGAAFALSGLELAGFELTAAPSTPVAACDGPAKHAHNPVANINAERPLALIFILAISPFASPRSEKRPRGVSAARRKKGIFGRVRAKTGQRHFSGAHFETTRSRKSSESMRRVPAGTNDVMSLNVRHS
jgi:hypothetical protein